LGWIKVGLSNLLGRQAEAKAADYLKQQGLKLICQNYRCRSGEIDLVMQDQQELVFVEVKYRSSNHFGGAAEYFHAAKRKKFESAVQHFLLEKGLNPLMVAHRIDLLAIDKKDIQWLKHL
jgi:putative endonuclease